MAKTKKNKSIFTMNDFNSGDGMITAIWGPPMWHFLHTISFNYPVKPTSEDKQNYKNFVLSLKNILPCKYCRLNLTKNLKTLPLLAKHLKSRETFSKYIYDLHELVNKMLNKTSGLSYENVRERYEHFRSRCTLKVGAGATIVHTANKSRKKKKEKGCVKPLYGKKSKCILKIVPQETKCDTFQINKRCIRRFAPQ